MSKGFSINDILGSQSAPAAPAGLKMQIVMLPAVDIEPNPENSIYEIGDVSMLKADIQNVDCAAHWKYCPPKVASICCWPGTGAGQLAVN